MFIPDAVLTAVREFLSSIRLSDFLDIAFASAMLYVLIGWARRTISRRVVTTALALAAAFLLTRLLDLGLTEMLIELLSLVLLIIAAVVFQNDIRRMVEQFGWPGWRPGRRPRPTTAVPPVIDVLADGVGRLAADRTGALIALKGKESWEHHINGGVELQGRLSESLLQSLFHPQTPGHDGALLMEGERATRFAVHLPLTTDTSGFRDSGTRHAAALGLSEHCDALVIVVSEERGTIGVAREGQLETLESPAQLKEELASFWRRKYRANPPQRACWWRHHGLQTAVVSILLATSVWALLVHETERVYRTFVAPVELRNMPADLELENPVPTDIRITLVGPEQTLRGLHSQNLAISLDLARLEPGTNEITISQENLELADEIGGVPEGLYLYRAQPPTLEVRAERLQTARVPVVPRTLGSPPEGLRLVVEPREVRLLVPANIERLPQRVQTEPINLRQADGPSTMQTKLQLPDEVRLAPDQDAEVEVRLIESDEPAETRNG